MTQNQIIRTIGLTSLITASLICADSGFAQSVQNEPGSVQDSRPELEADTQAIGEPVSGRPSPAALSWSSPDRFDKGVSSRVAIRSGLIVEVHATESLLHNALYYHIGKLDRAHGTVEWGPSHVFVASGAWPAVALTQDGHVIFTWSDGFYNCCSKLMYRVGTVSLNGDTNQRVDFKTDEITYDTGFHNSISINGEGIIAEAHESVAAVRAAERHVPR